MALFMLRLISYSGIGDTVHSPFLFKADEHCGGVEGVLETLENDSNVLVGTIYCGHLSGVASHETFLATSRRRAGITCSAISMAVAFEGEVVGPFSLEFRSDVNQPEDDEEDDETDVQKHPIRRVMQ